MRNHESKDQFPVNGVLEIQPNGQGIIRSPEHNCLPSAEDAHVSQFLIRAFSARTGDTISGVMKPSLISGERPILMDVHALNSESPMRASTRLEFEGLARKLPRERLRLETTRENLCGRVIDLMTPIGKGQRVLITGPRHYG